MKHTLIGFLTTLALAASAQAADVANVRIFSDAGEHAVEIDLDSLNVGESRQLATAAGVPAIVSRSEDGLRIEIAGKTTEVALGGHGDLLWVGKPGEGDKRVHVVKLDSEEVEKIRLGDGDGDAVATLRHVRHGAGEDGRHDAMVADLIASIEAKAVEDGAKLHQVDLGDGQRKVIVMRHKGEHGAHGEPLDDAAIAELIADVEAKVGADGEHADKERVIVTRKIVRDAPTQ